MYTTEALALFFVHCSSHQISRSTEHMCGAIRLQHLGTALGTHNAFQSQGIVLRVEGDASPLGLLRAELHHIDELVIKMGVLGQRKEDEMADATNAETAEKMVPFGKEQKIAPSARKQSSCAQQFGGGGVLAHVAELHLLGFHVVTNAHIVEVRGDEDHDVT